MTSKEPQPEKKRGPYEKLRNLQKEFGVLIIIEGNAPQAPQFSKFAKNLEQALTYLKDDYDARALKNMTIRVGKIRLKAAPELHRVYRINDITWKTSADQIQKILEDKIDIRDLPTNEYEAIDRYTGFGCDIACCGPGADIWGIALVRTRLTSILSQVAFNNFPHLKRS